MQTTMPEVIPTTNGIPNRFLTKLGNEAKEICRAYNPDGQCEKRQPAAIGRVINAGLRWWNEEQREQFWSEIDPDLLRLR